MRKKYASCTHQNFFPVYGKQWGQTLMAEAQARQMTRTDLIRRAVGDYLQRHPIGQPSNFHPGDRNPAPVNRDRVIN